MDIFLQSTCIILISSGENKPHLISYESKNSKHLFMFSLPWNQLTPLGYSAEILYDIIVGEAYLLTNGKLLLFLMSMCIQHQAFSQMFQHTLQKLDHNENSCNDNKILCELVRLHSSIKL